MKMKKHYYDFFIFDVLSIIIVKIVISFYLIMKGFTLGYLLCSAKTYPYRQNRRYEASLFTSLFLDKLKIASILKLRTSKNCYLLNQHIVLRNGKKSFRALFAQTVFAGNPTWSTLYLPKSSLFDT
jgi:hypothetical protein